MGIPPDLRSGTSCLRSTSSNNRSCTSQLRSGNFLLRSTTLLGRIAPIGIHRLLPSNLTTGLVSYRIVSYGITHYHTQCRDEAVNVVVARWCRCTKVCIIIGPCENSRGLTAISVVLYCSDSLCVCCIAVQQELDGPQQRVGHAKFSRTTFAKHRF